MDAVVRWAYGQGVRELDQAIVAADGLGARRGELEDAHAAYDALRAFESQADRTRTSIEATAQGLLRAYRFAPGAALGAPAARSSRTGCSTNGRRCT